MRKYLPFGILIVAITLVFCLAKHADKVQIEHTSFCPHENNEPFTYSQCAELCGSGVVKQFIPYQTWNCWDGKNYFQYKYNPCSCMDPRAIVQDK